MLGGVESSTMELMPFNSHDFRKNLGVGCESLGLLSAAKSWVSEIWGLFGVGNPYDFGCRGSLAVSGAMITGLLGISS